jgi:cytochrome bd-type quinol oxidase subunit 2
MWATFVSPETLGPVWKKNTYWLLTFCDNPLFLFSSFPVRA